MATRYRIALGKPGATGRARTESGLRGNTGLALPELLLVMGIIGLMAAISVPILGKVSSVSNTTAAKRNAQALAYLAVKASLAGNTTISSAGSKEDAIALLADGVYGDGDFSGTLFQVGLDASEQAEAAAFVEFQGGIVTYNMDP